MADESFLQPDDDTPVPIKIQKSKCPDWQGMSK